MQRHILKDARKAAGMTALALGEITGIREDRLYALERGRGRLRRHEALKLATALDVRPAALAPEAFLHEGQTVKTEVRVRSAARLRRSAPQDPLAQGYQP